MEPQILLLFFTLSLYLPASLAIAEPVSTPSPSPATFPTTSRGSVSVNLSSSSSSAHSTPYVASPYDVTSKFNPSMAIIVVVLLSAFFFMGFFSVYVRRCTTDDEFGTFPFPDDAPSPFAHRRSDPPPQGLDLFLLNRLPVVQFSALKASPKGVECAVCLCNFEEDEALRLLPNCGHSFHQDCIDMWLFSHTTCPLCRRSLLLYDKAGSICIAQERNPTEVGNGISAPHVAIDIQQDTTAIVVADEQDTPASESTATDPSRPVQERDVDFSHCGSPILGVMGTPSGSKKQNRGGKDRELRRSHSTGHSLVKGSKDRRNGLISSPSSSDTGDPSCSPLFHVLASNFHRSKSYTMLSNLQGVQQSEEQQTDMDLWACYPMRWLKKEAADVGGESSSSCSEPSSSKGNMIKSSSPSSSVRRTIRRLATDMDRTPQFFLSEHHRDFAQLAYVL